MRIAVPEGQLGKALSDTTSNPIVGNRTQTFTYHLQDNDGSPKGSLGGVTGGTLEWHANAQVKAGGRLIIEQGTAPRHNWLERRIKIVMHIAAQGSYPLGVFVASVPTEQWDATGLTVELELLDKCSILAEDYMANTYQVPKGTNVISRVRAIINGAGESAVTITDSDDELTQAMTWEAGTSKLTIINDMLEAANFFSLYADGDGNFRVERQQPAAKRSPRYEFLDNYKSVYLPQFSLERDTYSIPNKVVAVGHGSDSEPPLVAVATNENPKSPFSYQRRGRWIVDVQQGIDTTSQENLAAYARRRLAQLSSPQGTITIQHAPLPWLRVNEAVWFRREMAGVDEKAIISSMQIDLDPATLCRTTLLQIADI